MVANLDEMSANLNEISEKIKRGQGTLGGLITDPTIYNEIRSLFGKVNRNSLFKTVVRTTLEENEKEALK
jgi:phospholipid/cholesterol/gamma-HCH transport system substrate-binding protein